MALVCYGISRNVVVDPSTYQQLQRQQLKVAYVRPSAARGLM